MNKLLSRILKNKILNNIFTFIATVLILSASIMISSLVVLGIGTFLVVYVAGGIGYVVVKYCDDQYKILNQLKEE